MLAPDDVEPERLRPLMRVEYDRLVDLGVFADERIELLRGALVTMSPQDSPHAHATRRLTRALTLALAHRAEISCQLPLALADDSEPEPDVAVVPSGRYAHAHPTTAYLIVEVADSSLRKDRGVKRDIYAEAGIPEYWIVNVVEQAVEVYRRPQDGQYAESVRVGRDQRLRLAEFPDVEIVIADLF